MNSDDRVTPVKGECGKTDGIFGWDSKISQMDKDTRNPSPQESRQVSTHQVVSLRLKKTTSFVSSLGGL